MTKSKCFNYQCKKASRTNQEKHKIYEMKMIKWNDKSVDTRNQRSLYYKGNCQIHQEIFYQSRKDYEKIAIDNV